MFFLDTIYATQFSRHLFWLQKNHLLRRQVFSYCILESLDGNRFGKIVIKTSFQELLTHSNNSIRCQSDNGKARTGLHLRRIHLADKLQGLRSGHLRHAVIHQYKIIFLIR